MPLFGSGRADPLAGRPQHGRRFPAIYELKIGGDSGFVEVDLGGVTLTNIATYRRNKMHSNLDVNLTPVALVHQVINGDQRSLREELRFAPKTTGPLS